MLERFRSQRVCAFKEVFNPFVKKLVLDFSEDTSGLLDRRLGIAAAVLLINSWFGFGL